MTTPQPAPIIASPHGPPGSQKSACRIEVEGWTPRDFNNILRLARDLLPDAADYDRGEYRACLRPMTPDGPPILGLGRHRNLFLNCGHGHMGWTMACGTARIVADLMTGRMPDLDLEGLTVRR